MRTVIRAVVFVVVATVAHQLRSHGAVVLLLSAWFGVMCVAVLGIGAASAGCSLGDLVAAMRGVL